MESRFLGQRTDDLSPQVAALLSRIASYLGQSVRDAHMEAGILYEIDNLLLRHNLYMQQKSK